MNYCPECGSEISANAQFCSHCGTDLTEFDLDAGQSSQEMDNTQMEEEYTKARREFIGLVGLLGVGALVGGGAYWWFEIREQPEDVAEEFLVAIGDQEYEEANELVHPEARVEGAGVIADSLTSMFVQPVTGFEVDVQDTSTVSEGDGREIIDLEVELTASGVYTAGGTVRFDMRKHDDDWHVWTLQI